MLPSHQRRTGGWLVREACVGVMQDDKFLNVAKGKGFLIAIIRFLSWMVSSLLEYCVMRTGTQSSHPRPLWECHGMIKPFTTVPVQDGEWVRAPGRAWPRLTGVLNQGQYPSPHQGSLEIWEESFVVIMDRLSQGECMWAIGICSQWCKLASNAKYSAVHRAVPVEEGVSL